MDKILVDTSAWVASFAKHGHDDLKKLLKEKILSGEAFVTGMVLLELLQGTRNEAECAVLQKKLSILPFLSVDDSIWPLVARLSLSLMGKGVQASLPDVFISHIAASNNCLLLHCDSDFERIAKQTSLKTISFV